MNEYIIEITQVLKKEIKIKCLDSTLAEITVKSMYENGEIRLNQDDCIQSTVKLVKSNENNQPSLFNMEEINGTNN